MHCRLCLSNCSIHNVSKLFSFDCTLNWPNLISKYLKIEIKNNDAFSTVICQRCSYHIKVFHEFAQNVINCQLKLKDIEDNNKDSTFMIAEYLDELLRDEAGEEKISKRNRKTSSPGLQCNVSTKKCLPGKRKVSSVVTRQCARKSRKKELFYNVESTMENYNIVDHKCTVCLKVYKSINSFRTHMNTFHRILTCKGCGLEFKLKRDLRQHLGKNQNCLRMDRATITDEALVCKYCNNIFKTNLTLKNHIRSCHWDVSTTSLFCLHCGKEFHFKETLDYHLALDPTCSQFSDVINLQSITESETSSKIS